MRSILAGMIALSASIAVVDTVQAQTDLQRLPGYGSIQSHISPEKAPFSTGAHHRPAQYNLQPTQDDVEKIDRDNQQLDLPASQDDITGAGTIPSEEDTQTTRIEKDNPRLDGEITDICPSCGSAEDAPVYRRRSPIYNGFNHQPTERELRALHQQDVTPHQADETDRLYEELTSTTKQILGRRPARAP
jgi:hypothetical protein